MNKAPVKGRLLVDHDSRVVTTKAAQPGQRPIGLAQFVKGTQPQAIEFLAVLRDRGDLYSGPKPRLQTQSIGIRAEGARLDVKMRFGRHWHRCDDSGRLRGNRGVRRPDRRRRQLRGLLWRQGGSTRNGLEIV